VVIRLTFLLVLFEQFFYRLSNTFCILYLVISILSIFLPHRVSLLYPLIQINFIDFGQYIVGCRLLFTVIVSKYIIIAVTYEILENID